MTHTSELAHFIADIGHSDLSAELANVAKDHLVDTIGVAIAGADTPHARSVIRTLRQTSGDGLSTVIGEKQGLPVLEAIQANAVMAHGIDFDDSHRFVHPGCAIIPVACGIGEWLDRSGLDLLKALVAGYEASVRVSLAGSVAHRERGYHPTGTCNVFGSAAAAAVLSGLTADQIISAFGIAASHASGLTRYRSEGAQTKHLHAGIAARAGALSSLLAQNEFRGPTAVLEGELGFLQVLVGEGADTGALSRGLGETFRIASTDFKPYPSCRQTHAPVDLALGFVGDGLKPEDVDRVHLHTYAYNDKSWHLGKQPPGSELEAMLSITFSVAAALVNGKLSLTQFSPEQIANPAVLAMMDLIECHIDPEITAAWPAKRGCRMSVTMKDGKRFDRFVADPSGGDDAPMSAAAIDEKFLGLVAPIKGDRGARDLLSRLRTIEKSQNVGADIRLLSVNFPSAPVGAAEVKVG